MKDCLHCEHWVLSMSDEPCMNCNDGERFIPRNTVTTIHAKIAEMETTVNLPAIETVNHPAHYQGKYECIDEMIALFGVEAVKAFCRCNVYKYRYRADRKNGDEDIKKCEWYMQKLIELESDDK